MTAIIQAHLITETERLKLIAELAATDNDILPSARSKSEINIAKALVLASRLMTDEQIDHLYRKRDTAS